MGRVTVPQAVELIGASLVAFAAWFIHPAATVAVVGVSAILLANFGDWGGDDANTG